MSVEPGVVDTKVLVYAMDTEAPQHSASRALLEAGRAGATTLYVTSQILCEFYSIVTNARRVAKPRPPADALPALAVLLAFLQFLPTPARTVTVWMELLQRHPVTGGDVFEPATHRHHAGQRH
jgi:predicted nucleic acid-binding protein